MKRFTLIIISVFLFSSMTVMAQQVVTLQEAIREALKENNQIKAMEWHVKMKENEKWIALSSLLPKILVEERFSRTNNPTYSFMSKLNQERFTVSDFEVETLNNPEPINNYQTVFSIEQPLFVKKAYVSLGMAKEMEKATEFERKRLQEEIALHVFQSYVHVVSSKERLTVALKGLDDAKEHLRIAKFRYDSGLGLYSDALRAEVAVIDAEKTVVEAQTMVSISKRVLGLLLGRDEPADVSGYDSIDIVQLDIKIYLERALERYDLKAMQSKYRNAVNAVKRAEADYFPVFGIGGSYQFDDHATPFGSEGESWQVMAFMRINIFDGFRRENERGSAEHQARSQHEYLEAMKKQVNFDVHNAYLTVEETQKKYELTQAAVRSAEEGARLVEKRYQNSLAPMVSLLDAQLSLDKARADEVAMRGEYLIALMRLEYASGMILNTLLGEE